MEHSQHHGPNNIPQRLAKAGLHVVANPLHLLPDKRVLHERLGSVRAGAGRSYALQSMQKVPQSVQGFAQVHRQLIAHLYLEEAWVLESPGAVSGADFLHRDVLLCRKAREHRVESQEFCN